MTVSNQNELMNRLINDLYHSSRTKIMTKTSQFYTFNIAFTDFQFWLSISKSLNELTSQMRCTDRMLFEYQSLLMNWFICLFIGS